MERTDNTSLEFSSKMIEEFGSICWRKKRHGQRSRNICGISIHLPLFMERTG